MASSSIEDRKLEENQCEKTNPEMKNRETYHFSDKSLDLRRINVASRSSNYKSHGNLTSFIVRIPARVIFSTV